MADIFLSYSRADQDAVAELVSSLERIGFSIWWDGEIPPGENFRHFIDKKLDEAPAICVVWSANSVKSRWVAEEAEEGVKRSNLIPIALDDTDLPRGFRAFQCAQLMPSLPADRYEQEFKKLVDRLRVAASKNSDQPSTPVSRPKRRSAFEYAAARGQNLAMMVAFTAVAGVFVFFDFLVDPENLSSLWFRLGVMLPSLFALTAFLLFARRPWQLWLATVLSTWIATPLAFHQVSMLHLPEFKADGFGTAITVILVLVLSAAGLVHTHLSRATALIGGIGIYSLLAYYGGAKGAAFWGTAIANMTFISLFLWLGFFLRDRRVR